METNRLCDYGCGQEASFYFEKVKKYCCSKHYRKCPYQAYTIGQKRVGKKHSNETKALIGLKSKQRIEERGGSYFKGKKHTDETKQKISEKTKGRESWMKGLTAETDERVKKMTDFKRSHPELFSHKGVNNGMYGNTHSEEVKRVLRERNIQCKKWVGKNNYWYGKNRTGINSPRYLSDNMRREWKDYKNQARFLTEKEYQQNKANINPNNLPRGINQYHLDHIVPLWFGFLNNIDPVLLSKIENLRMMWYKDNIKRKKSILDEDGNKILNILIEKYFCIEQQCSLDWVNYKENRYERI